MAGVQRSKIAPINVADPKNFQENKWGPLFAKLRREDPVHFTPESPHGAYWSVTKYDDIVEVDLDYANYSAKTELGGIMIDDLPKNAARESFIRMDPPEHTAKRKVVAPIVAPTNLANIEGLIRERTETTLDSLPRKETFDWVKEVSTPLTTMMLATLFDFPWEDRAKLTWWSDVVVANVNDPEAIIHSEEERMKHFGEMAAYFRVLWDKRGKEPPKFDLISMLAHSEINKDMTPMEFLGTLTLLIVGGNDTTRNTMSAALMGLCANPEQYELLRSKHDLVPSLVSEAVRYHSPLLHLRRTTVADVELSGTRIPEGSKVVMWYISGNRDEERIDDPDSFRIDRDKPRQHIAFGSGIHRCVGERLAELQLRILWEEVLKRDLRLEVMGPPKRLQSNLIHGVLSLPARITN